PQQHPSSVQSYARSVFASSECSSRQGSWFLFLGTVRCAVACSHSRTTVPDRHRSYFQDTVHRRFEHRLPAGDQEHRDRSRLLPSEYEEPAWSSRNEHCVLFESREPHLPAAVRGWADSHVRSMV